MNLKKFFRLSALMLALPLAFTACSDDEPKGPDNGGTTPELPAAQQGVFVYNSGNLRSSIDGSLSFVANATGEVTNNVFSTTNSRSLGATVQDGVTLGDYHYIAVYGSNTIEVVNKLTNASVAVVTPDTDNGQPRDIVTDGKYVYVSMYTGFVSRIDPKTASIDKTVQVGANPEEMAIANGCLYVVNSDGMNYANGYVNGKSVSKINLDKFEVEKTIAVGLNPTKVVAANDKVYVLCTGNYADIPASINVIDANDNVTDTAIAATLLATYGDKLYVIDYPYYKEGTKYIAYNQSDLSVANDNFVSEPVDAPAAFAIDATTGEMYISSYNLESGYASYSTAGYLAKFKADGTFEKKWEVGVGPTAIAFLK